jgi:signal peptidase I
VRIKRTFVPMILSLLQPGLGQLYNSQVRKAFIFLAVLPALIVVASVTGLIYTFRGFVFWLSASLIFQVAVVVDAGIGGFRRQQAPSSRPGRLASAVFVVLVVINLSLAVTGVYPNRLLGFRAYVMRSASMSPALLSGDRIVADMNAYAHTTPRRGDVIVFAPPGQFGVLYTKRVAAVAGDTIQVTSDAVEVNGKIDPHAVISAVGAQTGLFGPMLVPVNSVFVLGDDVNLSYDSRYFGSVPVKSVRGKLLFVYWSPARSRIGMNLR